MRRTTKDYYRLLGISRKATTAQIKKAYHRMAKRFHPDHNPGDKAAENRFKDVNEAYEVLSDKRKRAQYDNILRYQATGFDFIERMARKAQRQGAAGLDLDELKRMFTGKKRGKTSKGKKGAAEGKGTASEGILDGLGINGFSDVLDIIFDKSGEESDKKEPKKATKGEDIHYSITVTASMAKKGGKAKLCIPVEESCNECKGSGAKAGTKAPVCTDCKGRGQIPQTLGTFAINRPCTTCLGRGRVIATPCAECKGSGVCEGKKELSVKIPPRVKDGQKIRLKGLGMPGPKKAPAGDLYLKVTVVDDSEKKDPPQKRKSPTTVDVEVNPVMAMLGGKVTVELSNGEKLKIRIPPEAKDGKTMRLKGAGPDGSDLRVRIHVTGEDKLSDRARKLMEQLKEEEKGASS